LEDVIPYEIFYIFRKGIQEFKLKKKFIMKRIILSTVIVLGGMLAMQAQSKELQTEKQSQKTELQQQKKQSLSTQNNTPIKQAPGTNKLEQQVAVDPVKVPAPVKNFVSEKYKNSTIQKASRNSKGVYQLEVLGSDNVVKTIFVDEKGREMTAPQVLSH